MVRVSLKDMRIYGLNISLVNLEKDFPFICLLWVFKLIPSKLTWHFVFYIIIYTMNTKSLTVFALLLVMFASLLTYAFTKSSNPLNRLDEISKELAETTAHQEELQMQLLSLEMEIADGSGKIDALNDEATAIFMKYILIDSEEAKEFDTQCDYLIAQELWNIESGIQTKEWFIKLVAWVWCQYDWPFPEETKVEFTNNLDWYPGKLTEDGSMQQLPTLLTDDSHARFKELCAAYGLDASMIYHLEDKYGLVEGILPAILIAETSGWFNGNYVWSGCYNLGNVWNNDRGNRVCFNTKQESIEQVAQTLNNKYLWWIQTLWCLSNAGSCLQKYDTGYRYASSNWNWERNVVNVLENIYMTDIDPVTFNFRK